MKNFCECDENDVVFHILTVYRNDGKTEVPVAKGNQRMIEVDKNLSAKDHEDYHGAHFSDTSLNPHKLDKAPPGKKWDNIGKGWVNK